jgi:hypothetical protein
MTGSGGATVYANNTPGLARQLVELALIPAHAQVTWIDDQIQPSGPAKSVSARVGEGTVVTGTIPQLKIEGAHPTEEGGSTSVEGDVANRSGVPQSELVVNALAQRRGRVVAAGTAVIPSVPSGSPTRFQLFLVGSPAGASLTYAAPATTPG